MKLTSRLAAVSALARLVFSAVTCLAGLFSTLFSAACDRISLLSPEP